KSTIEDITFESPKGYIVVINTDSVGHGDEKLGKILLKSFIYSLTGQDVLPEYILLYNGGVKLTVEDSDSFQDLKDLEEAGVKIMSCGICLDYYDLKDKISVGEVTNMFRIVELMRTANRVVRP
ncbi:sulfurtransferase-like selenium metabolism protein YedF, partial [Lactobacillus salivarius]